MCSLCVCPACWLFLVLLFVVFYLDFCCCDHKCVISLTCKFVCCVYVFYSFFLERVCARLKDKSLAGASISLKLKTTDFQIVTRNRQLSSPTQRASLIYQHVAALIDAEADGRTFRLIGVCIADLSSGFSADPPELFKISPR